ncbi:GNAT family N-acetyltransferase [Sulfobacillus harzensis]|nr:GNAT family protein [Sulfobacillus harzensis]
MRLLTMRDVDAVYSLTVGSRSHLRRWLPWVDDVQSPSRTEAFIRGALEQFAANEGFQSGIWWKDAMVGCVGINTIDWSNRAGVVGYWLGDTFQGRGIMTQAVKAVIDIGFQHYGLNKMEVRVATGNTKSSAIPRRLGFHEDGIIRHDEWLYDHFVDSYVFSMLASEWLPSQEV